MKNFIKNVRSKFTKENSEYWLAGLFALAVFIGFAILGAVLNWHTYPNGVLQKIPFSVIAVAVFAPVALFLLHAVFPNMRDFLDKDNENSFYKLTLWQKYLVSLLVFALLFWGMVMVATSL
jgi:hypothetical protein